MRTYRNKFLIKEEYSELFLYNNITKNKQQQMAIIHYAVCARNVWKLGSTLNHIYILLPIYFNVILHGNCLQSCLTLKKFQHVNDFITSFLSYSFFPVITLPSKHNYNNVTMRFALIDRIWLNFLKGSLVIFMYLLRNNFLYSVCLKVWRK